MLDIEETWPGILAHKLGHLLQMAQEEQSSVAQSYATLFAAALDHAVLVLRRNLGTSTSTDTSPAMTAILSAVRAVPGP